MTVESIRKLCMALLLLQGAMAILADWHRPAHRILLTVTTVGLIGFLCWLWVQLR